MIVEVRTESELKELQDILIEFYRIMPYKQLPKESKELQEASNLWIENWFFMIEGGVGKILALKKDNNFIGAIGLVVTPSLEDGVMTCMEAFWYVDKNHRGQGLKLLIKGQKVAKEMGAKAYGDDVSRKFDARKSKKCLRENGLQFNTNILF